MSPMMEMFYDMYHQYSGTAGNNDELARLAQQRMTCRDRMDAALNAQQRAMFEEYVDLSESLHEMTEENKFVFAFHLGAMCMEEMIRGRAAVAGENE